MWWCAWWPQCGVSLQSDELIRHSICHGSCPVDLVSNAMTLLLPLCRPSAAIAAKPTAPEGPNKPASGAQCITVGSCRCRHHHHPCSAAEAAAGSPAAAPTQQQAWLVGRLVLQMQLQPSQRWSMQHDGASHHAILANHVCCMDFVRQRAALSQSHSLKGLLKSQAVIHANSRLQP